MEAYFQREDGADYGLFCEDVLEDAPLRPDQDPDDSDELDEVHEGNDSDDDW